MPDDQKVLSREASFHDSIADEIQINDDLVKSYLSFDSPGEDIAAKLPRLKARLATTLGQVSGLRVLIYGCGNDAAPLWFAKSGAVVDAIDISPKSVANQKTIAELAGININAVVMDAHKLDLPSNNYDIVYGNAILHHLSIKEAASEIYRVLKPGGKGIFRDVMKGNVLLQAFRFATPFWRTEDEHPLTNEAFALLDDAFSNSCIDYYVFLALPYIFSIRIINVILKKLGIIDRVSYFKLCL